MGESTGVGWFGGANSCRPQGQRESRCGGALVRVCHEPSGAWYFSPTAVREMAMQPAVSAYSSSVALAACA